MNFDTTVADLRRHSYASIRLPPELVPIVRQCFVELERFHSLDQSQKESLAVEKTDTTRGFYVGHKIGTGGAKRSYDSFEAGTELGTPGDSDRLHLFQSRNRWPHHLHGFELSVTSTLQALRSLADDFARRILASASIGTRTIHELCGRECCHLRLMRYSGDPDPARGHLLSPHTDYEFLSIVISDTSGLEIFVDGVGWVRPQNGLSSATLMTGDSAEILTGRQFRTALHRVRSAVNRQSLVFFLNVDPLFEISNCSMSWLPDDYRPRTIADHVINFTKVNFPHLQSSDDDLVTVNPLKTLRLAAANQTTRDSDAIP